MEHLVKTAARYVTTVDCIGTLFSHSKQLMAEYYIGVSNSSYINSEDAAHSKLLIPNILFSISIK